MNYERETPLILLYDMTILYFQKQLNMYRYCSQGQKYNTLYSLVFPAHL